MGRERCIMWYMCVHVWVCALFVLMQISEQDITSLLLLLVSIVLGQDLFLNMKLVLLARFSRQRAPAIHQSTSLSADFADTHSHPQIFIDC